MKENLAAALSYASETLSTVTSEIVQACEEAKGKSVTVLDVSKLIGLVDQFVIVSGRSDRHAQGIANKIMEFLGRAGIEPQAIEGFEEGQWILLDYSDVVVHIFYEPVREHYDLESLWMNASKVELKLGYGVGVAVGPDVAVGAGRKLYG